MSAPITPSEHILDYMRVNADTADATGGPSQPAPAAPPSRSEIERKLSFRSAAPPPSRTLSESPKKSKVGLKPNHTSVGAAMSWSADASLVTDSRNNLHRATYTQATTRTHRP